MSAYGWEHGKKFKRVKATGTVILNPREDLHCSFESYQGKCTAQTLTALQKKLNFKEMLPAQAQCFNGIFKGRDVILHSRTGSGKTLAYALPIIERRLTQEAEAPKDGPFLLVLCFSTELAMQTKSVLKSVYGKRMRILVPALEPVEEGSPYDIVIGTVSAIDKVIRGVFRDNADDTEAADGAGGEEASEDDEEDKGEESPNAYKGLISAKNVRAIVVDEVDTTLGPKYSHLGRRMKHMLKFIRRENGSLTRNLTRDFRAHHYVLVGATIPNWVVRAGFLGLKKYYYRLVEGGSSKLPPTLTCYSAHVPAQNRNAFVVRCIATNKDRRVVVFTSGGNIDRLEEVLMAELQKGQAATSWISVRSLSASKDELQRIQCMQEYNDGVANVLLCTDVAARGLDFTNVGMVIMTSVPQHAMGAETFVHRAGRTARCNAEGRCLVLFDASQEAEVAAIRAIEAVTHIQFHRYSEESSSRTTTETEPCATFELKVRNAFSYASTLTSVPAPCEVLERELGPDNFKHVRTTEQIDRSTLRFSYPLSLSHVAVKLLWKYDVKDVTHSTAVAPSSKVGTKRKANSEVTA